MNLKRIGQGAAVLAALVALAVYVLTLARTVTWQHNGADSGEFAAAAFTFGIPHPPGYPLYMILAGWFARLPLGEPAFGVGLLSALAGAAAVFVLARAGDALIAPKNAATTLVPPLGALAFAFAPMPWSQATIAEVYTLNLFLVALILWACVSNSSRRVYVAALAFGLGMAHHLSILLLLPGAWIAIQPTRKDWRALFLLVLPLAFYVYLPLAALPNPAVKWGEPTTLDGFLWLVTAEPYRTYWFGLNGNEVLSRLAFAARALIEQFTLVGVALLAWGLVQLALNQRRRALALGVMFVPIVLYAILYASRDSFLYLIPAFAVGLLWLMYGAADVLTWAGDDRLLRGGAVAAFALLPVYQLVVNYPAMDLSQDRAAFEYARTNLEPLPVDTVLFADTDEALFALWYYRHAVAFQDERSVIVSQSLLDYDWYYDGLRRIMSEVQFQPPNVVTDAHQRAREIIRVTFAEGRAVCFTDSSPLLPEFEYEERGVVKCVVAEKGN